MHNREQRTQKTERNMKKTLIAAALATCVGTQLFAQNVKEGVILFGLTSWAQSSVSTSKVLANQGNWSQQPQYYKTQAGKLATTDVIQAIAYVLHNRNNNFYGTRSQLVLVQGELSGFFNLTPQLANDTAVAGAPGTFNVTPNFTTTTLDMQGTFAALATGRHILQVPAGFTTTGAYPPGHHQPWGQVFVKTYDTRGTVLLCENVTPFFSFVVEECYDCFYLNSFVTDTSFSYKTGASGLPCCTTPSSLLGSGKDRYYMTLSFDNTDNNPYLNRASGAWLGGWGQRVDPALPFYNLYVGVTGVSSLLLPADGITPDLIRYVDPIRSGIASFNKYVTRFTLNGIVTYSWNLKFINSGDSFADFVGNATYNANGYGFIALRCSLLEGTMTITERIVKLANCCSDNPWYDWWYGTGWNGAQNPWFAFAPAVPTPFGFETPINTEPDLSFHYGFDNYYEPGYQWGTNPRSNVPLPTQDPANPWVYAPSSN